MSQFYVEDEKVGLSNKELPKIGFLYLDYVLRFFDYSNFKGWPNKIESVTYHWGKDKERFIKEVKKKQIDVYRYLYPKS